MPLNQSEILEQLQKAREKRPPKVKKPLRNMSKKKAAEVDQEKELAKQDELFYMEIWQASPHFCYNCKGSLGRTPHNFMFHHLLEKRNYPELRHVPENIALVCLTCHSKCETNINFAPRIKELRERAKKLLLQ